MLPNPNANVSLDDVIKLVKLPISEKIPQSEIAAAAVPSKLGFVFVVEPGNNFVSCTFNKVEAELDDGADTASVAAAAAAAAVVVVAVKLELSLLE